MISRIFQRHYSLFLNVCWQRHQYLLEKTGLLVCIPVFLTITSRDALKGSLGWLLHYTTGGRGGGGKFWFCKVKHKVWKALVWASKKLRLQKIYVCANFLTQQKPQDALHDKNSTYAIPEPQLPPTVLNYPSWKNSECIKTNRHASMQQYELLARNTRNWGLCYEMALKPMNFYN